MEKTINYLKATGKPPHGIFMSFSFSCLPFAAFHRWLWWDLGAPCSSPGRFGSGLASARSPLVPRTRRREFQPSPPVRRSEAKQTCTEI